MRLKRNMNMKKRIYLVWAAILFTGFVTTTKAQTGTEPMKDACSITCYEKTPSCYVTQGKDGCLDISDKKPECNDGKCVCKISGCEKTTVIKLK
jgi:hypothetical protein